MKIFSALLPTAAAALLALITTPATAQEADPSVPVAASTVEPPAAPSLLPLQETIGVPADAPLGVTIPSAALTINQLQTHTNWIAAHDKGTSGTASGTSTLLSSPALSGRSQKHTYTYTHYGGERWSVKFGTDANATNFLYNAYVYIVRGASNIANIEMDMNQVMPNGQTVIYGFQCDGWSNTWDYTAGTGWSHSTHYCDPAKWKMNAWHHVQISYSRNSSGYVTYHAVWLDGVKTTIGVTVHSARSMGWRKGSLVTNFQLDGANSTSGSATVYVDKLTVSRW
jgi:hypothetical protein